MTSRENPGQSSDDDQAGSNLLVSGYIAFGIVGICAVVVIYKYIQTFGGLGFSDRQDVWGQAGDFFGGMLNPVIGLVTIYLVLVSVQLQRRELKASLAEMRSSNRALAKQNKAVALQDFQQTFFTWLESYREIVLSIHYNAGQQDNPSGREAMHAAWNAYMGDEELKGPLQHGGLTYTETIKYLSDGSFPETKEGKIGAVLLKQWEMLYEKQEHNIDLMFRTLYRLLKWIDEQPDEFLDLDLKWHYTSIVRAQISKIEMMYLFYNGFTPRGKNFTALINKYALFDNLRFHKYRDIRFLQGLSHTPYSVTAFESEEARQPSQPAAEEPAR